MLECAAATAAQTKLRATKGAQLRLKTYVRRNGAKDFQTMQPIDIEFSYLGRHLNRERRGLYMPHIDGLIADPISGMDMGVTQSFLIDSGAAITILGPACAGFLNNLPVYDHFLAQYGQGQKRNLPVYELNLLIKGYVFDIKAALDPLLKTTNLLGTLHGLEKFRAVTFSYGRKKTWLTPTFKI